MSFSVSAWDATRSIIGQDVTLTINPSEGGGLFTIVETLTGPTVASFPPGCGVNPSRNKLTCDYGNEYGTIVYQTNGVGSVSGSITTILNGAGVTKLTSGINNIPQVPSPPIQEGVPAVDQCSGLTENDCIYESNDQCIWYGGQCMSECPGANTLTPLIKRIGSTCATYCGNNYCDYNGNVLETFVTCPADCQDPSLVCGPLGLANCRTQEDCWAYNGYWVAGLNRCDTGSCPAGTVEDRNNEGGVLCNVPPPTPPPAELTKEDNLISRLRFILTQPGKLAQVARTAGALRCYFDASCNEFGDDLDNPTDNNILENLLTTIKLIMQDQQSSIQKTVSIAADLRAYYSQP